MRLFRPVGSSELELIKKSEWTKFPPRFDWQPYFYPVFSKEYAEQIANWNEKMEGTRYIVEFEVDDDYVSKFEPHVVGSSIHKELWVPAAELEEFNSKIIGKIKLI